MNFKKFVASLAVSTMLVGSQAAVYADDKSTKSSQSQNETIGIVKKVVGTVVDAGALYNFVIGWPKPGWSLYTWAKNNNGDKINIEDTGSKMTWIIDGAALVAGTLLWF